MNSRHEQLSILLSRFGLLPVLTAPVLKLPVLTLLLSTLLVASGCKFGTEVLDDRECSSNEDCSNGFTCVQGLCQGVAGQVDGGVEEDAPDLGDAEVCRDHDEDNYFAGDECEERPVDCNDFDSSVYPTAPEICDGKDNNCDDLIDLDDEAFVSEDCPHTEGVCADATRPCVDNHLAECSIATYGEHYQEGIETICDGLDNNCNGDTDEDAGTDSGLLEQPCYTADDPLTEGEGQCVGGVQLCDYDAFTGYGGQCIGEVVPGDDDTDTTRCDHIDNDCDGLVDPNCSCVLGDTLPCYTGGEGTEHNPPCHGGHFDCSDDGRYGTVCLDEVTPRTESCGNPGIDYDCDGDAAAADIDGWGVACETGLFGVCLAGTMLCVEDDLACVQNLQPAQETCSNPDEDNDCNETLDDIPGLGGECRVTEYDGDDVQGECQFGTRQCVEGQGDTPICVPSVAVTEICNDRDDDCTAGVDNGFSLIDDEFNCGSCGYLCGGERPSECCQGSCVDTDRSTTLDDGDNLTNCGGCGTTCGLGDELMAACCGGDCTDLAFDNDNCGECGFACDVEGRSSTCCGGVCVDPESDELHCGVCGDTCDADTEQCCGSVCRAYDDDSYCGDCETSCTAQEICCSDDEATTGFSCDDLDSDGSCGGCGVLCTSGDYDAPACCDSGDGLGVCTDLDTDFDFCGVCAEDCGTDTGADACCEGACTDLDVSYANCGGCGDSCDDVAGTDACSDGACRDTDTDFNYCGAMEVVCGDVANADACCDGHCTDLETNLEHCGGCALSCESGQTCCAGFCVNLDVDPEGDLDGDLNNCGACGTECFPLLGQRCCEVDGVFSCLDVTDGDCPR